MVKVASRPSWRLFLAGAALCALFCCKARVAGPFPDYGEFREQALEELTAVRREKAERVQAWLKEQQGLAKNHETRTQLFSFFENMQDTLTGRVDKKRFLLLNREIERFFVYRLGTFYDLLFIDADQRVFYSVKMEDDFRTSLAAGPYADTRLAEAARRAPEQPAFIDFQYYGASDEAAAFQILPFWQNGRYRGMIALQVSVNHLNRLLTDREGLGRTGEAYLVNREHLMLTESRFINADTVLTKEIDTRAANFRDGESGAQVITDYRGVRVLSSFDTLALGRARWRIIVEKDESEVITDYYRSYRSRLFGPLAASAAEETAEAGRLKTAEILPGSSGAKRVDVSEIQRARNQEGLFTPGIATCTGIVAYETSGGFAYMAHLSPLDESYASSGSGAVEAKQSSDLLALLLRKIRYFEVKPCDLARVRFAIAATHTESLLGAIERLLGAGIRLNQVRAGILPDAHSISLFYDAAAGRLTGAGYAGDGTVQTVLDFADLPDLGTIAASLAPA